jgi:transposase-like protein
MAGKFRRHTAEFKRQAVQRMKGCDSVKALCKELGIARCLLYRWKDGLDPSSKPQRPEGDAAVIGQLKREVARLKAALGAKTLEIDFFKGALQKVEARRQSRFDTGEVASTTKSGK